MTRIHSALIAPAAAVLMLAACAPTGQPVSNERTLADQTCFSPGQVRGFTKGPRQTLLLGVGQDSYELTIYGACPGLDSALGFALEPGRTGASRLCPGDVAQIAVRGDVRPVEYCSARVGPRYQGRPSQNR